MSVMKQRDAASIGTARPDRLSDQDTTQVEATRRFNGPSKKLTNGMFDSIYLRDKSIWIHIPPKQSYEQWVWDRERREPVKVSKTWYQYEKHFYPATKRSFTCSAGPRRADPCYGCAIRRAHYRKLDAVEERTGVRPKGEPAVSGQSQYAFSVVVMENIVTLPKRNPDGTPKVSRSGSPIYDYVPEPWIGSVSGQNESRVFGRRYHLSLSKTHWRQLLDADRDAMRNYCANCATNLYADAVICPDCEAPYALSGHESGDSLTELRHKSHDCSCGYSGPMVPRLHCTGCGHPEEGRITDFDLRIKKEVVSKTASNLKIIAVRKPLSTLSDESVRQSTMSIIDDPLDLPTIFAPTRIEDQQKILGTAVQGVDPRSDNYKANRAASPDVESYHDEESDDPQFG